jgi:elongation factor P--beta-lysine ligase
MAILAGIDLLAKYYIGSDRGNVGERFRTFFTKYFKPLSPMDEEIIYQLRNALLHAFGLYSERSLSDVNQGDQVEIYRFRLYFSNIFTASPFIESTGHESYSIDVAELHRRFETAVTRFQGHVEADQPLQDNFRAMFKKYGAIHIG